MADDAAANWEVHLLSKRICVIVAILAAMAFCTTSNAAPQSRYSQAKSYVYAEFGSGWLGQTMFRCVGRETGYTYDPNSINWHDRHANGRGSFGLFQIGRIHIAPGGVAYSLTGGNPYRLLNPWINARAAHLLYNRSGLRPWGGGC